MDKRTWIIVGGTAVISCTAGALGGFLYAKKTLVAGYTAILDAEVEEIRNHYARRYKTGEYETPQDTARRLGVPVIPNPDDVSLGIFEEVAGKYTEEEMPEDHNIFEGGEIEVDEVEIENEIAARSPETPYIISQEEFFTNDPEHNQVSLTYYEGDQILGDERDEPVTDIELYVGTENLKRFGHRSKDRNILYIRNEKLDLDLEIARSRGQFREEVLGLREAPTNPRRRFQQ